MENVWLDDTEIQSLINELNPHLQKGNNQDANWQALKNEQHKRSKFNTEAAVKLQTPVLLAFEQHYGFTYRRWDGAHWHTEVRQVETKNRCQGLNQTQKHLKENIDTIMALKQFDTKIKWITPVIKSSGAFDSRYQLLQINQEWMICIGDKVYAESTRRQQQDKNYTEISFSTKNKPVFTLASTETILDKITQ